LRHQLVQGTGDLSNDELLTTLKKLLEVPVSHDADTALEIALLSLVLDTTPASRPATAPVQAPQQVSQPIAPPKKIAPEPTPQPEPQPEPETPNETPEPAQDSVTVTVDAPPLSDELWQAILEAMKKRYNTLYGLLRMAEANFDGNNLTLCFNFAFHQKRLNEAKNKQAVIDIVKQVSGQDVSVTCVVIDKNKPKAAQATPAVPLDTISNIFGGAEVIE
jgi:hypothetical protein